ncbi:MAG: hypothetical protein IJH90_08155 [Mogibacterium sp.]|nr:hypothetical protein [Mogibacterium sp.]
MVKKTNAFDLTNQASEQATVSGAPKETAKKKITLSITQEDSDAVKMYALKNHTTVSDLLHEWIQKYCQSLF